MMREEFVEVEIEKIDFEMVDVITTSKEDEGEPIEIT